MSNQILEQPKRFLDPSRTLFLAGLSKDQTFADLGAGSGFYSLAAGSIIGENGQVYSVDVMESALDHISGEARLKGLRNIKTLICDLEQTGSCDKIPAGTVDMILLGNIIHQIKQRKNLFAEAYRLLRTGGKLLVIEWNQQHGPIGPPVTERVNEAEINSLAKSAAFKNAGDMAVDAYHYSLIFIK